MHNINVEQRTPEWHAARWGVITGKRAGKLYQESLDFDKKFAQKSRNAAYWQFCGELLSDFDPSTADMTPANRGTFLEPEARELFNVLYNKDFQETGIGISENNDRMGVSGDGYNEDQTEAIEVKCLSEGVHFRALHDNEPPQEHLVQCMQYFSANEKLHTLYFVMYHPTWKKVEDRMLVWKYTREDSAKIIKNHNDYFDAFLDYAMKKIAPFK